MIKQHILVHFQNTGPMVVQSGASRKKMHKFVFSPLYRHLSGDYFRRRPRSLQSFPRDVVLLSDPKSKSSPRRKIEECVLPNHAYSCDLTFLPKRVLDEIGVKESRIHVVRRRIHGKLCGSQISLVNFTKFNLGNIVKSAILDWMPRYFDSFMCTIYFGIVGPEGCFIVPNRRSGRSKQPRNFFK